MNELNGMFVVELVPEVDPKTIPAGAVWQEGTRYLVTNGYAVWGGRFGLFLIFEHTAPHNFVGASCVRALLDTNHAVLWSKP